MIVILRHKGAGPTCSWRYFRPSCKRSHGGIGTRYGGARSGLLCRSDCPGDAARKSSRSAMFSHSNCCLSAAKGIHTQVPSRSPPACADGALGSRAASWIAASALHPVIWLTAGPCQALKLHQWETLSLLPSTTMICPDCAQTGMARRLVVHTACKYPSSTVAFSPRARRDSVSKGPSPNKLRYRQRTSLMAVRGIEREGQPHCQDPANHPGRKLDSRAPSGPANVCLAKAPLAGRLSGVQPPYHRFSARRFLSRAHLSI